MKTNIRVKILGSEDRYYAAEKNLKKLCLWSLMRLVSQTINSSLLMKRKVLAFYGIIMLFYVSPGEKNPGDIWRPPVLGSFHGKS